MGQVRHGSATTTFDRRQSSNNEGQPAIDGVDGSRSRHRNVPHWVLSH